MSKSTITTKVVFILAFTIYTDSASARFIQADPIGLAGGINPYAYVENSPVNAIDPMGLDTYRQNRILGKDVATKLLLSHTFMFTTNRDGSLKHTYSWGNDYDANGNGLWFMDRAEDRQAADQAINNSTVCGEKVGGETLDNYIHEAFFALQSNQSGPSSHPNLGICYNCKTESNRLFDEAMRRWWGK